MRVLRVKISLRPLEGFWEIGRHMQIVMKEYIYFRGLQRKITNFIRVGCLFSLSLPTSQSYSDVDSNVNCNYVTIKKSFELSLIQNLKDFPKFSWIRIMTSYEIQRKNSKM